MKLLVVIPHYCVIDSDTNSHPAPDRYGSTSANRQSVRAQVVSGTIARLHQTFGTRQAMIDIAGRQTVPVHAAGDHEIDVVIVTTGKQHLLSQLNCEPNDFEHVEVDQDPMHLGFAAHRILQSHSSRYDMVGYIEDDLWITDSWMLEKLRWFVELTGPENTLLPHRFERASHGDIRKCYVDGTIRPRATQGLRRPGGKATLDGRFLGRPIEFEQPSNPHSGCFFLTAEQMEHWSQQPDFGQPSSEFIGPLESAATLGLMANFHVYKPTLPHARFLEIEHADPRFIQMVN